MKNVRYLKKQLQVKQEELEGGQRQRWEKGTMTERGRSVSEL
jgi:hypothetical protein